MVVNGLSGMEVVGRGRDLEEENVGSKQSHAEYGFSTPKRTRDIYNESRGKGKYIPSMNIFLDAKLIESKNNTHTVSLLY
jgi:hypothetical protein